MDAGMQQVRASTRRWFLGECAAGLGSIAFGALAAKAGRALPRTQDPLLARAPHFAPRARRVIYLHMAGSPSQTRSVRLRSPS